ncbi:MAG: hypothetical protein ACT4ON_12530 [Bacteroidota bacterium]
MIKNNNDLINKKEFIISLIRDDLTNIRLVQGIEKLGINCSQYHLHLSEIFFSLIGFKSKEWEERAYDEYLEYSKRVLSIDIVKHPEKLTAMANTVYDKLMEEKNYKD